jgi:hypothetical protein
MEAMMAAPHKVTPETIVMLVEEWLRQNTVKIAQDVYEHRCAARGRIGYYEAYMSIHTPFPDVCAGFGEVQRIQLPVCTACHPEPPVGYGCMHVADAYMAEAVNLH